MKKLIITFFIASLIIFVWVLSTIPKTTKKCEIQCDLAYCACVNMCIREKEQ